MLDFLHINNLALIEDMKLEFTSGINVLTGETGAGKSFILKALGFVLGDRLGADVIRPGAEKAQVEAIFTLNGDEKIIKRELLKSGRSRVFINDSIVSQETLRELKDQLISYTSQHAQQKLLSVPYQAKLLEEGLNDEELLTIRGRLLEKLEKIEENITEILRKEKEVVSNRELLEMQLAEIEKVNPKPGEEENLESVRLHVKQRETEQINYNKLLTLLHGSDENGLLDQLKELERILRQITQNDPALLKETENIETLRQSLLHLINTLPKPARPAKSYSMDEIEERLFAFAQLKRKLKRTMPQILSLKDEINEKISFLDACKLDLSRLNKEKSQLSQELKEVVEKIKPQRIKAAEKFAKSLEKQLFDLGFSKHARVVPEFTPYELWSGVEDIRGRILWAPNPGQNPQPLDKIASGGELSRFILALHTLAENETKRTYIFDEVDAGVGGMTLNKIGEKLLSFSRNNQLILITHWPQLAVLAENHFLISKTVRDNQTYTTCRQLTREDKKAELVRMSGGNEKLNLI